MHILARVLTAGGAGLATAALVAGCATASPQLSPAAAAHATSAAPVVSTTPTTAPATSTQPSAIPSSTAPTTTAPYSAAPTTSAPHSAAPVAAKPAAPPPAVKTLASQGVPCSAKALACVSLSKQEAWLLKDGKIIYGPVPVATGRPGLNTPAGTFHVLRKYKMWYSTAYNNAPMPFAIFFYEGDAFHEDPVTVKSHGCVHLTYSAAERFYSYLQLGDEVQIAY
jgi:lipoprotein-anchoring transpeptidase ErfK/SrfK